MLGLVCPVVSQHLGRLRTSVGCGFGADGAKRWENPLDNVIVYARHEKPNPILSIVFYLQFFVFIKAYEAFCSTL